MESKHDSVQPRQLISMSIPIPKLYTGVSGEGGDSSPGEGERARGREGSPSGGQPDARCAVKARWRCGGGVRV